MELRIAKWKFSLNVKRAVAISILLHGVVIVLVGKILCSTEKPAFEIIPVRLLEMLKTEDAPLPLSTGNNALQEEKKPLIPPRQPPKKAAHEPSSKKVDVIETISRLEKEAATETLSVVPVKTSGDDSIQTTMETQDGLAREAVPDLEAKTQGDSPGHEARQAEAEKANEDLESQNKDAMLLFMSMVRDKIEKSKFYPEYAKKRGYEGSVGITFKIAPGGDASGVEVSAPAAVDLLNKAAEKAVQNAAPFAFPRPRGFENKEIKVKVDIVFRLG